MKSVFVSETVQRYPLKLGLPWNKQRIRLDVH